VYFAWRLHVFFELLIVGIIVVFVGPFSRVEFIVIVREVDWVAVVGAERGRFLERLGSSTVAMFTSA